MIIEVLSPGTEAYDRGAKFSLYRELASLRDYLLVNQGKACIEHFHRQADGSWIFRSFGPADTVTLESIDSALSVAAVYDTSLPW